MKGRNSDPPDGVEVVELPPDTTFETIPTDVGTVVVAKFQGPNPLLHPARLAALLDETDAAFSSHPLRLDVGLPEAITAGAEVSASLFSVDDLTRETLAIARPQRRDADMLPLALLKERLTQSTADLLCATLARVKERYRLELADGLAFLLRLVLESNGFIRGALHSRPRWEDVYRLNVGDDRLPEGAVVHGPHENVLLSLDDMLDQWRAIEQHALDDLVRSPDGSGERASYGTIPRRWWVPNADRENCDPASQQIRGAQKSEPVGVYSVKDAYRRLRWPGLSYEAFRKWRHRAKEYKPRGWLRQAVVNAWDDDLDGFATQAIDRVVAEMEQRVKKHAQGCGVSLDEAKEIIPSDQSW